MKTSDSLKIQNELEEILEFDIKSNSSLREIAEKIKAKMFAHINTENIKEVIQCEGVSVGYGYGQLITVDEFKKTKTKANLILISKNGSLNDIQFVKHVKGLIILNGTSSSHSAIVARSLQIPTVIINNPTISNIILSKSVNNVFSSIDGTYGKLYLGKAIAFLPNTNMILKLLKWNEKYENVIPISSANKIHIMANADNEYEAGVAIKMGAVGIGSSRVEHMFLNQSRITIIQALLLLPEDNDIFKKFCKKFESIIEKDLTKMLTRVEGKPYTIRLLDALPSEFFLDGNEEIDFAAMNIGISKQEYLKYYSEIGSNSNLDNLRGCRLGIIKEKTYISQISAIIRSLENTLKKGKKVDIRIIIPYVSNDIELEKWTKHLQHKLNSLKEEYKDNLLFMVGTMIEIPRAALIADKLASKCELFTYGTNDLTQYTYSIPRSITLEKYNEVCNTSKIFQEIDCEGVGKLIENSIEIGRKSNQDLIIGICGEHVNNIDSLKYFKNLDIDYISCIPGNVLFIRTLLKIIYLQENKY